MVPGIYRKSYKTCLQGLRGSLHDHEEGAGRGLCSVTFRRCRPGGGAGASPLPCRLQSCCGGVRTEAEPDLRPEGREGYPEEPVQNSPLLWMPPGASAPGGSPLLYTVICINEYPLQQRAKGETGSGNGFPRWLLLPPGIIGVCLREKGAFRERGEGVAGTSPLPDLQGTGNITGSDQGEPGS